MSVPEHKEAAHAEAHESHEKQGVISGIIGWVRKKISHAVSWFKTKLGIGGRHDTHQENVKAKVEVATDVQVDPGPPPEDGEHVEVEGPELEFQSVGSAKHHNVLGLTEAARIEYKLKIGQKVVVSYEGGKKKVYKVGKINMKGPEVKKKSEAEKLKICTITIPAGAKSIKIQKVKDKLTVEHTVDNAV